MRDDRKAKVHPRTGGRGLQPAGAHSTWHTRWGPARLPPQYPDTINSCDKLMVDAGLGTQRGEGGTGRAKPCRVQGHTQRQCTAPPRPEQNQHTPGRGRPEGKQRPHACPGLKHTDLKQQLFYEPPSMLPTRLGPTATLGAPPTQDLRPSVHVQMRVISSQQLRGVLGIEYEPSLMAKRGGRPAVVCKQRAVARHHTCPSYTGIHDTYIHHQTTSRGTRAA